MIHKTEGINVTVLQEDIIILVESIGDLEVPHISSWLCCVFLSIIVIGFDHKFSNQRLTLIDNDTWGFLRKLKNYVIVIRDN